MGYSKEKDTQGFEILSASKWFYNYLIKYINENIGINALPILFIYPIRSDVSYEFFFQSGDMSNLAYRSQNTK